MNGVCKMGFAKFGLVVFLVWVVSLPNLAQHRSFRIMTYNVENLFDTCHDARHDDLEFLPSSSRSWNSFRYWKKQGWLSRTIVAACGPSPIDLIALCEVENDTVVRDLVQRTRLHRLGYRYLVTESLDRRGIDVALLYQPDRFRLVEHRAIRIAFDVRYGRPTRDILHVAGRLPTTDTLDIFINHWPSRRGGTKVADDFRWLVGRTLRNFADSIYEHRQRPNIVMVGDFNDEYDSRSIADGLGAVCPENNEGRYVVLSANLKGLDGISGTYKYQGMWNQLDQVIISCDLLENQERLHSSPDKCRILSFPFLLEEDESRGGVKPNRTYLGPVYKGGVSDHLPLILDLAW